MPRNGSGTYQLPAGNPVVTGTIISSTTQNTTMSDVATALTNSIAKDGQTVPTANLPMGGFKHTGAADATATGQYLTYGQDGTVLGDTTISGTLLVEDVVTMTGLLNLAAGADIASASTVDLTVATGNCPKITGTTDIEAWTMNTGQQMKCIAGGAFKLVYDATTNNIEGGADYTCAAGDIINLVKGLDGVVRVRIEKQDGTPVVNPFYVGEIFDWPHASTPSYALLCDGAEVSRTVYADLFAAIGTTWGAGDGSTTFNIPNIPAGYTTVQANANEGTSTTGEVKAHTHTYQVQVSGSGLAGGPANAHSTGNTGSTGGAANLAAGVYVRKCIRFM